MAKASCGHQQWKWLQRLLEKLFGRKICQKSLKSKTLCLTEEVPQYSVHSPHEAGKRFWLLLCISPVLATFSRHLLPAATGMGRLLICQSTTTLINLFLRNRSWEDCSHGFQQHNFWQYEFHINYEALVAMLTIFFKIIGIGRYYFWSVCWCSWDWVSFLHRS